MDACVNFAHILPKERIHALVKVWLQEDVPNFDCGGVIVGEEEEAAQLLMKSPGVIAGVPFFNAVFRELDCTIQWFVKEGEQLNPTAPLKIAQVNGKCRNILLGERIALNCICRASGIASTALNYVKKTKEAGWNGKVAGTRKTTPGFRLVEKYALLVGGADTHRYNLSSMVMLKDNHIWSCGSIKKAVETARSVAGFSMKIEVECQSLDEGMEAAGAGAHVVMFDNFDPKKLHEAAKSLKNHHPHVIVEASGGIEYVNITSFCSPNVDIISTSKLIQGYPVVDFSLKIMKKS